MNMYQHYIKLLGKLTSPTLILDLEAMDKNIAWVVSNSPQKKIRIATKSIRSKDIIKKILASHTIFQGVMTYDLREALWLRDEGIKDILMGYPSMDLDSLHEVAKNPNEITLMVDLEDHLEVLQKLGEQYKTTINVCVDIDLSMDLPKLHFGVYRSSLNTTEKLKLFSKKLKNCSNLKLVGLMGYEAQIAGVMDKRSAAIRFLKKLSIKKLRRFREECVDQLKADGFELKIVNGGGTGSLLDTGKEHCVTEITIGSGLYAPVLFDFYKNLELKPALFYSLPIVRKPTENIYTCFGGGYIGSGSIDKIKAPTPYLPFGMNLLTFEGAGEVQTPFSYNGNEKLEIGDSVFFRHAKAGEICERFHNIVLIQNSKIQGYALTYRGEGKTFI
jgi:D-serine deaminase-like pyridoxal phosphate-dependent protein